jgi:2-hydroxy-6-oxonona-2,4-dienedioate hydrolase
MIRPSRKGRYAVAMGEAKFTTVSGIRTRYYERGNGPVLLLIHGGSFDYRLGIAADDWDSTFDILPGRYRLIAPDKLGAGGTDSPASDELYTMRAVVNHLKGFIANMCLDEYVVVGHSRGALAAARLAADQPDRARALVVLAGHSLPAEDPLDPPRPYFPPGTIIPTEAMIRTHLGDGFDDPAASYARDYIERKLANYHAGARAHADRPIDVEQVTRVLRLEQRMFLPDMRQVKNDTLQGIESGALRQPILVIWGLHDASASFGLGAGLFALAGRANPATEFHAFGAGRHLLHVEYPAQVGAVIHEFLSRRGTVRRPAPYTASGVALTPPVGPDGTR